MLLCCLVSCEKDVFEELVYGKYTGTMEFTFLLEDNDYEMFILPFADVEIELKKDNSWRLPTLEFTVPNSISEAVYTIDFAFQNPELIKGNYPYFTFACVGTITLENKITGKKIITPVEWGRGEIWDENLEIESDFRGLSAPAFAEKPFSNYLFFEFKGEK